MTCLTRIDQLPQITCWPKDGGAFVLLPQVFSQDPDTDSILRSNLGMYRIQLSGNRYRLNEEVGLHYQLKRGISVHHQKALARGQALKVSIFIGGPPAHALAAVMPLPEGVPEVAFAGAWPVVISGISGTTGLWFPWMLISVSPDGCCPDRQSRRSVW